MNTNLSAWKYVKNNKRSCAVLITSLSLSFMAMYVLYALLHTTVESFGPVMIDMPKRISYASITGSSYGLDADAYGSYEELSDAYDEKQEVLMERLRSRQGISDVFYTQIIRCVYKAVVGQYSFEVPLMESEKIPGFLEHMNAELIEGRLPAGDGEMLVDATIMKNSDYSLGGYFMENWYGESFKIVGIIRSDYPACVGTPIGYTNNGWYLVILNDENTSDLSEILSEEGIMLKDADEVIDSAHYAEVYARDVTGLIQSVIDGIMLAVTIVLTILVMVTYVSFMRNRISEYCLYASIGYGKKAIYGMILREMLILFGIASLLGIVSSFICGSLINSFLIIPRGLIGKTVYLNQICKILSIFIYIIGMLQIPVLVCISDIRTIDAVEKQ